MKTVFAVLIAAGLLAAAAPQAAKSAAAPAAPAPAVKRQEIPKGAVELDRGRYSYTDADGKKWIYVQTPFGVSRTEDKPAGPSALVGTPKSTDPFASVKATLTGDTVTFERPGPFGISRWQKKLPELDDREKAVLRRTQEEAARPAAKAGEGSAKQE